MSDGAPDDPLWLDRFAEAGPARRAAMLGGGAVRLVAGLIDRGLDRAATVAVEAHDAFRKELDPNVSDARILEETRERPERDR